MKLSIITPFYNEEEGIATYFDAVTPILQAMGDYEIICVDDGSRDKTFALLKEYHEKNHNIKVLKFSRNFGKELALTAGLDYASGDAVIPIDADLQDPPELFPEMVEKYKEGYDVVLMQRKTRDEGWFKRTTAKAFYYMINALTSNSVPKNVGDFRLMSRKVIGTVCQLREKNRFMKGLLSWGGYKTTTLFFDKPDRMIGQAKQNYKKLFALAFDGIFSFSSFPLKIWSVLGVCVSLGAFSYGLWTIIDKLLYNNPTPGYASTMVVILFFNGLVMLSVGILGEYISRIFDEVKNRPLYVLDEKLIDD